MERNKHEYKIKLLPNHARIFLLYAAFACLTKNYRSKAGQGFLVKKHLKNQSSCIYK